MCLVSGVEGMGADGVVGVTSRNEMHLFGADALAVNVDLDARHVMWVPFIRPRHVMSCDVLPCHVICLLFHVRLSSYC